MILELEVKEGVVCVSCKCECGENDKYCGSNCHDTKAETLADFSFAKHLFRRGKNRSTRHGGKDKEEDIRGKLTLYSKACKGVTVAAENTLDSYQKVRHILKFKYHPTEVYHKHCKKYLGDFYIES